METLVVGREVNRMRVLPWGSWSSSARFTNLVAKDALAFATCRKRATRSRTLLEIVSSTEQSELQPMSWTQCFASTVFGSVFGPSLPAETRPGAARLRLPLFFSKIPRPPASNVQATAG